MATEIHKKGHPDKDVMCHRTGFQKSCLQCVIEHKCQLWQPLNLNIDLGSGAQNVQHWGCMDGPNLSIYMNNIIGVGDRTVASVDKMRAEVAHGNASGISLAIGQMNQMAARLGHPVTAALPAANSDEIALVEDASEPQKLISQG